jgi:predicted membrane protein
MLSGVIATDLSILCGWGIVLMHLCHLWLGLSSIGYICTGLGARSRAFIIAGIIHLVGILALPFCLGWQFLVTGLIMTANLLMFAGTQWDMRPPIDDYAILTSEQKEFNREQYLIRQTQ